MENSKNVLWVLTAALILLTTNPWLSWKKGILRAQASDVNSFAEIASAAPGLPRVGIPQHHAERLFVHYPVGLLSRSVEAVTAKPADVVQPIVYSASSWLLLLSVLILFQRLLSTLRLSVDSQFVLWCLLLLNPYAIRFYLIVPGMLADVVFLLGMEMTLWALLKRKTWLLVAGGAIALVGRQTGLMLIPACAFWIYTDPNWQAQKKQSILAIGSVFFAEAVVLWLMKKACSPFSTAIPSYVEILLFPYLVPSQAHYKALADQVFRIITPFLISGALLGLSLERKGRGPSEKMRFYGFLVFSFFVILQPLVTRPDWNLNGQTRLSVLGLIPVLMALGLKISEIRISTKGKALFLSLASLASLHHVFSTFGPPSAAVFFAGQIFLTALIGLLAYSKSFFSLPAASSNGL